MKKLKHIKMFNDKAFKQITKSELEQFEKDNYYLEDTLEFTTEELEIIKNEYEKLTLDHQDRVKRNTTFSIFSKPFTTDNHKWYFKRSIPPKQEEFPFCYGPTGSNYTIYLITMTDLLIVYKTKNEYFIETNNTYQYFVCEDLDGLINCLKHLIIPITGTKSC